MCNTCGCGLAEEPPSEDTNTPKESNNIEQEEGRGKQDNFEK